MATLAGRFRSWLTSVEFAVTTGAIAVALVAGAVAFETWGDSVDAYFVVLLAGVGVPNIYENQWPRAYERRVVGVAWALVTSLALVACYLFLANGLRAFLDGFVPGAVAFAVSWLLGIYAARVYGWDSA
ncbi:hypothetical protein HALDL1_07820 [Halobacterium sp. DL1]|jgi:Flp pilus assembly pilin Flp|nr:hypothetical protein HALDL1_07820 [Halobacterium sp. DL1]